MKTFAEYHDWNDRIRRAIAGTLSEEEMQDSQIGNLQRLLLDCEMNLVAQSLKKR